MSHIPTKLEVAAGLPLPAAQTLAGRFLVQPHSTLASDQEYARVMQDLHFGVDFSDYMASSVWTSDRGWADKELVPFGPLTLSPAASVLHYGQEVFEGLKAYRREDGSIWTFRPRFNAERFNHSARRLALPELPVEDFIASIVDLVAADGRWVPKQEGASLYLRPFMFASEPFLGVKPAHEITYLLIASPVGPYFAKGFGPVSIYVTREYHRAGLGGTGDAKTSGNYAASLLPQQIAYDQGYEQVCFLDSATSTNVDELGGMNVFVVYRDGVVRTPKLTGAILEGGTRSAIIQICEDKGIVVEESSINFDQLLEDIRAGVVTEVFACGTAAVITPVGKLGGDFGEVTLELGQVTRDLYDTLTGIQWGTVEDTHNWCYRIA
ncbi:MAG: branched-chain amino acid aminotransferase [Actinomycetaceae bacterium]|nr:branched-chain amino acid aminotransferase [Actinomycetaceae bacterium]